MFAQPTFADTIPDEVLMISKLEATSNAIRLRIAGLAPDQLYRGTRQEPSIAELIAAAVDREQAYLEAFQRGLSEDQPRLGEPTPGPSFLDRDFAEDLARFFDLRRQTLDLVRNFSEEAFARRVTLPDGEQLTLHDLALRLQRHDAQLLRQISARKRALKAASGINELLDMGVAGKLGENIAQ